MVWEEENRGVSIALLLLLNMFEIFQKPYKMYALGSLPQTIVITTVAAPKWSTVLQNFWEPKIGSEMLLQTRGCGFLRKSGARKFKVIIPSPGEKSVPPQPNSPPLQR